MAEQQRRVQPRYLDGAALLRKRLDAGLEQAELAKRVDSDQRQISKWERGAYGCRLGMLHKLADALGCKPADLMLLNTQEAVPETNGAAAL